MREREIFDAALAIANPAERSAYLGEVCSGNPALREHLQGLLAMHQQLGSFLEPPDSTCPWSIWAGGRAGNSQADPVLAGSASLCPRPRRGRTRQDCPILSRGGVSSDVGIAGP